MNDIWYNYPRFKADEPCRYCVHSAKFHIEVKSFIPDNIMLRWIECDRAKFQLGCKCQGYAPVDNLLYLEMKTDEQ